MILLCFGMDNRCRPIYDGYLADGRVIVPIMSPEPSVGADEESEGADGCVSEGDAPVSPILAAGGVPEESSELLAPASPVLTAMVTLFPFSSVTTLPFSPVTFKYVGSSLLSTSGAASVTSSPDASESMLEELLSFSCFPHENSHAATNMHSNTASGIINIADLFFILLNGYQPELLQCIIYAVIFYGGGDIICDIFQFLSGIAHGNSRSGSL